MDRQTDRQTDIVVHREVILPKIASLFILPYLTPPPRSPCTMRPILIRWKIASEILSKIYQELIKQMSQNRRPKRLCSLKNQTFQENKNMYSFLYFFMFVYQTFVRLFFNDSLQKNVHSFNSVLCKSSQNSKY